jgi:hypothetical protein
VIIKIFLTRIECNGKAIAVKMDKKVNNNNIQAMIDVNMHKDATLCTDESTIYQGI